MLLKKYKYFISYLNGLNEFKFDYSLERIKKTLQILKNPQNHYDVIHITGSNGKGSVCMYISSIFDAHKIKVGTYLSPHIKDVRERILINCKKVKKNFFLSAGLKVIKILNKNNIKLTYFEFLTVVALLVFKSLRVKIAVIEVGLGGRYDATNLDYKNKLLSVITSISKEHTNYLGNTEMSILKEKAEIIKNSKVICNLKKVKLKNYILEKYGGKVYFNDHFYKLEKFYYKDKFLFVEVYDKTSKVKRIYKSKMLEIAQIENILTVLTAIKILKKKFRFTEKKIKRSIEKMFLYGRLTWHKNGYYLSVAHNPEALKNMLISINKIYPDKSFLFIFSLLKDKNINRIAKIISCYKKKMKVIITSIYNERAMDIKKIKKYMIKYKVKNYVVKNNKEALNFAYKIKKKNDIIIIGGSFYLIKNFI